MVEDLHTAAVPDHFAIRDTVRYLLMKVLFTANVIAQCAYVMKDVW